MFGIWFLDNRESFNAPKASFGWTSPKGIEQDLESNIAEADKTLGTNIADEESLIELIE